MTFGENGRIAWSKVVFERMKAIGARISDEVQVCRRVLAHPQTPRAAKWLLSAAIAYAVSPVDLIPDFIPVLGYLDDAVLVPLLVVLALRAVPGHVVSECREAVAAGRHESESSTGGDHSAGV